MANRADSRNSDQGRLHAVRYTVEDLATMPYREFRAVVEEESLMREGASRPAQVHPETAQALREPSMLRRWYEVLIGLQKSVEGQLAAVGADARRKAAHYQAKLLQIEGRFSGATLPEALAEQRKQVHKARQDHAEAEAELERWRASALRWKSGNEDRLAEARFLLREQGDDYFMDRTTEERNRALARVMELETALRKWRDSFSPEDLEKADPDDLELMKHVT